MYFKLHNVGFEIPINNLKNCLLVCYMVLNRKFCNHKLKEKRLELSTITVNNSPEQKLFLALILVNLLFLKKVYNDSLFW